jgi:8-hydroxy-5-deazaflavin:NADPH oxidoreductase
MRIAILGTGMVGRMLAEKLVSLRHDVVMGTRNPEKGKASKGNDERGLPAIGEWLPLHPQVKLVTQHEAAAFRDLVINATNGMGAISALTNAGKENLKGKLLLDVSNPLDFSKGMPPSLWVCNTDSLGEMIQREFPETKVVKGFNTMTAYLMVNPSLVPGDHTAFICGNDDEAKKVVRNLMNSFGWKDTNIIDLGDITAARGTEQVLPIWVRLMGKFSNPVFNFSIVKGTPPKG